MEGKMKVKGDREAQEKAKKAQDTRKRESTFYKLM